MDTTTTNNNNNNNINNNNNNINDNGNLQKNNIAINGTNQDTAFDVVLQWCSLACSKLIFHPIEFPIHALTTFIQSTPTPQPIKSSASKFYLFKKALSPSSSPTITTTASLSSTSLSTSSSLSTINTLANNLGVSSLDNLTPQQFTSESLWKLFKQKGYHIYDGGLVYLAHNMIVIIFNFAQRYVSTVYNSHTIITSTRPTTTNHHDRDDNGQDDEDSYVDDDDKIVVVLTKDQFERRKKIGKMLDILLSLLKNGLTLPLDVLMTRLIVHRFYKSNSTSDCTLKGIFKNEGLVNGLYAGWEVVALKSLLETIFKFIDNRLVHSNRRGPFTPTEKSPAQILLLCIKISLDYILNVLKVRLNIRNTGFFKTLKTIYKLEGIRGLFSGLNTYFILFPLWMIGILLANVIFVKLKQKMVRKLPPKSKNQNQETGEDQDIDDEDQEENTGVGVSDITTLSSLADHHNSDQQDDDDEDGDISFDEKDQQQQQHNSQ
ncbi:mitochondrial substrate carrier family protein [Cavenderia fasciculata]|uniref:Mitochondrial substrate carrier family protein n=1 Tax=Cavenderia fasciculata TaxID=261658 RepID=F4QDV4_CACFS|nr:mitochondrial substrate carrier family protein [Cavenderia fasciculata]EGG13901.1 mitochondrial substrate carrier family protein [Cavenderia fasciculata]|eukprot:XP_004350609.1 mitochondrial substrate carrier family protein [Cavenderia fasciculata]